MQIKKIFNIHLVSFENKLYNSSDTFIHFFFPGNNLEYVDVYNFFFPYIFYVIIE